MKFIPNKIERLKKCFDSKALNRWFKYTVILLKSMVEIIWKKLTVIVRTITFFLVEIVWTIRCLWVGGGVWITLGGGDAFSVSTFFPFFFFLLLQAQRRYRLLFMFHKQYSQFLIFNFQPNILSKRYLISFLPHSPLTLTHHSHRV